MRTNLMRLGAAAALALAAQACTPLYGMEDVVYGGDRYGDEVRGEVRRVDASRRRIEIGSGFGTRTVYYDRGTDVVYGNRRYGVGALERGDRVVAVVRRGRDGRAYADRIRVTRSVRDGRGDRYGRRDGDRWEDRLIGRRVTLSGRVESVDRGRGAFRLDLGNGGDVWVTVPRRLRDDRGDRFFGLDRGERVRVEGRWVARDRFEAERFR